MYTTAGLSTVWSQSVSEWNGMGPHAGMQATLFRSHAREEMAAAETALAQAIALFEQGFSEKAQVLGLLRQSIAAHDAGLRKYDGWDYLGALNSATQSLSLTSQALAQMGHPGQIFDPLQIDTISTESNIRPVIGSGTVEQALKSIAVERYKGRGDQPKNR